MKCQTSVLCLTSSTNHKPKIKCQVSEPEFYYWFLAPWNPSETLTPATALLWVLMTINIKIFSLSKNIQHLDRYKQREFALWITLICDQNPKARHCQSLTANADSLSSSVLYLQKYFMLSCAYLLFTSHDFYFNLLVCGLCFSVCC